VADLIATIGHNLDARPGRAFFQRKVFYDNIPEERMAQVREAARKRGESAIDALVSDLAVHDRDANPKVDGTGRMRAMVGIYYHEAVFTPAESASTGRAKRSPATRKK
jgi:Family of unknown function (DUF6502)